MLKPLLSGCIRLDFSPNQITLFTCFLCVVYAALMAWTSYTNLLLLCFPLLMFVRMALNAMDGMLAKEINKQTSFGLVLNEVCDVVSDAALFSAFLFLLSGNQKIVLILWWLLTLLALLTEFISLAVYQTNRIRSHTGPFGKSDRAVYLGILAIVLWFFPEFLSETSAWIIAFIVIGLFLAGLTLWNRFKSIVESSQ